MTGRPAQPRSLLIVRNPRSRRAPPETALTTAVRRLERAGWDIEMHTTRAQGHATELARSAAGQGVEVVLACGGDGTVREVAEGLAHSETALGVIPAGTANVWAHEIGVPAHLEVALAIAARGARRRVDTGVVNGMRFLLMCSTGLDAAALADVEGTAAKQALGRAAYVLSGAHRLFGNAPVHARIEVDGRSLDRRLLLGIAGNTRLYGGVARLTADALMNDGLLDVCLLSEASKESGRNPARRLYLAWRALRGELPALAARGEAGVDYLKARRVRIETDEPLPAQADGEVIGATPLEIEVDPGSLLVITEPRWNVLFAP